MLLDLTILTSGKKEKIDFEFEWVFEDLGFLSQHSPLSSGLFKATGQVQKIGETFFLQLDYHGTLSFVCERCLESLEYTPVGKVQKALSTQEDDEDVVIYTDHQLNLLEVVEDDILLNLPIQIVCKASCKGLCHDCGKNLNHESCACQSEAIDSRLESLKNFFNKHEEV